MKFANLLLEFIDHLSEFPLHVVMQKRADLLANRVLHKADQRLQDVNSFVFYDYFSFSFEKSSFFFIILRWTYF